MPTPIYLWNFETGTTEGWSLGPYSSLDGGSAIQGTYSLKYSRTGGSVSLDDLHASISAINLAGTTKPLLVLILRDASGGAVPADANNPGALGVVVKTAGGEALLNITARIAYRIYTFYKIIVVDLSTVAGLSDLTIELRERGNFGTGSTTRTQYFDMIAIFDGCDYEYDVAVIGRNAEDRTITINVPDADKTLPANVDRWGLNIATPPWFGSEDSDIRAVTSTADTSTLIINSPDTSHRHSRYATITAPTYFHKIEHRVYPTTLTTYGAYEEKIVVVFMVSWSYARLYAFNVKYTINGITPPFATALHTTTYGTTVSGQKDYGIKIHANSLAIAINVQYVYGDNTLMNTGTLEFEVWDTGFTTKYGSGSVDLTAGTNLTSAFATGIPVDTDLVLRIKWSMNASARIILKVSPIFKVD